jgi:serine/threonine protein kinase/Flp pilus assembly protein TadD
MAEHHHLDPTLASQTPRDEQTATLAPGETAPSSVKQWGEFQLLQRLGQGAFGEVYRAWDPVLEREIALKLLLPRGFDLEEEYISVVAEARAIARMRHPNIVSVYGVDRRDGRVGFWSDYVRGRTLSSLVEMEGPLSAEATVSAGIALCDALAAVHGAGLLHRDIKASNAMRDENGRVLLMDFGLSQEAHRVSLPAGTPKYMAPELLLGEAATVQTDLFAMGVLLHYLSTGKYPQVARNAGSKLDPAVPRKLRAVVEKAIRLTPGDRYLNATQMREALTATLSSKAIPKDADPDAAKQTSHWKRYLGLAIGAYFIFSPMVKRLFHTKGSASPPVASMDNAAAEDALNRYDIPGNTALAISLYQKALANTPEDALAEAGHARASWRMYLDTSDKKWIDAANQASDKAMSLNPRLAEVETTAGALHVGQGKVDVGMQELRKALALDGRSADVHAALGEAYRKQGRTDQAEDELRSAMDLDDDNWRWPYLLGALNLDAGDWKSARENLQRSLDETPDNARVLYDMGVVNWKQDRLQDATADFSKAIQIDPTVQPTLALGSVLLLQGNDAEAVATFRQAVTLNPKLWSAWGGLAQACEQSPDHAAEADGAFRKAIELASAELKNSPEDANLVSQLGSYYAHLHQEASALPLLRKSVLLAPSNPEVLFRVGTSYEVLGKRQEALKFIGDALNLGFSVEDAKRSRALQSLRKDPHAPQEIRA